MFWPGRHNAIVSTLLILAIAALSGAGEAGWLSRLSRHADDTGMTVGKAAALGALSDAADLVAKLPATGKGITLAAHLTPEGHWKFVNREGQVFTAASAEEMARVVKSLEPAAPAHAMLTLYLSEDAALQGAKVLEMLPQDARLHVVTGDQAFRLKAGPEGRLAAEVRPNLALDVADKAMLREAVSHLSRSLNKSNIRIVALEPGGPRALSSVPSYDPATKAALVDPVDPATIGAALSKVRHQTVVVTGRVEGDTLVYKPSKGGEGRLSISQLARAAEEAEASLVVLHAQSTRQPGGRNRLWQTVSVSGLDEAMQRATYADFLNALAASRGELMVSARPSTAGRIVIAAQPSGESAAAMTDAVGNWFSDKTSALMGELVIEGVEAFVPDKATKEELDLRIVPGVPSWLQFAYLGCLVMGLIGWEHSFAWWRRVWPPERREEYGMAAGYHAARLVRTLAAILIFVPMVGIPALIATLLMQLWRLATSPIRVWRWIGSRLSGAAAR